MFLDYLLNDEKFEDAAPRLRRGAGAYAPSFYAPYVLAAALAGGGGHVVVAPDGEAATRLAADLSVYLDVAVPVLPARGVLYGADVAPSPHVVGERQQALAALAAGGVVVAEAVALLERFLPLELQPRPLTLVARRGDRLRRRGRASRRARLRAHRAGPRPRRVRRARRPHRRLSRARRPPARGVLGRRGRAPAHLLHLLAAHDRRDPGGDRVRRVRGRHVPAGVRQRAAPGRGRVGAGGPRGDAGGARAPRGRARARGAGRPLHHARRAGRRGGRSAGPSSTPTRPTARSPTSTARWRRRCRARVCASGSTRRSPTPAPSSPRRCTSTSCSATSRSSSPPRGRSSRRATSPAPSATSSAWSTTTTASSSSSATRARPSAPRSGCATSRPRS